MADRQSGFTLLEMMVAMAILVGGLTALIALLTVGVSTRRSAELRQQAVWLADRVIHEVEQEAFDNIWILGEGAGEIPDRGPNPVDEVPGMTYTVRFHTTEEAPDLVLAEVRIRWSEQGEEMAESFERVLFRQEPFSRRASRVISEYGR